MKGVLPAQYFKMAGVLAFVTLVSSQPAAAQNLIPDPTFSSGVSAWTLRGALASFTRLEWIAQPGADGAVGFARLSALTGGPGGFISGVCVPATPATVYSWGGSLHFAAPQQSEAGFFLYFFSDSACANPTVLLSANSRFVDGSTADPATWYPVSGQDVTAPATTASAAFEAVLSVIQTTPSSVDFDNVYFGPQGTRAPVIVPTVPALSRTVLMIFGASLTAAALLVLVRR
jgi:hypothetical protein